MGRRLGQHFLIRPSILESIAEAACPVREPLVIEIGPGHGALSGHLLERADRVIAVELDERLADQVRRRFGDRIEVVCGDVLETDLSQWGPAVIAGNLPYYITSPILDRIFALGPLWRRATLLVQKEVAARLSAAPGRRDYGYLSVTTQLHAGVQTLFAVPPAAFRPPPKVDSAVVLLEPRATPLTGDPAGFLTFVSHAFRQKRKMLRNNLAGAYGRELVDAWPEASLRAEQISLEHLLALYDRIVRNRV